jgi:hypothetical protein
MMSSDANRFLVAPAESGNAEQQRMLDEVQRIIAATPGASVVKTSGAPAVRLVVEMQSELAQQLQAQFGHGLIIEPDAPLSY